MKSWPQARQYPSNLVQKEINEIKFLGVPLVFTFYPLFKYFDSKIHKNLYLLYMDREAKRVFMPDS